MIWQYLRPVLPGLPCWFVAEWVLRTHPDILGLWGAMMCVAGAGIAYMVAFEPLVKEARR